MRMPVPAAVVAGRRDGGERVMPLCYARGQWLRLSRAEMADLDVDPAEGRDDDGDLACPACGILPCACGDDEEEE